MGFGQEGREMEIWFRVASIKDVGLIDGFIGLMACLVIKSSRKRKLFSLISDFGKLMLGNVFFLTFLMNPKSTPDLEILMARILTLSPKLTPVCT